MDIHTRLTITILFIIKIQAITHTLIQTTLIPTTEILTRVIMETTRAIRVGVKITETIIMGTIAMGFTILPHQIGMLQATCLGQYLLVNTHRVRHTLTHAPVTI